MDALLLHSFAVAATTFVLVLLLLEAGWRLGRRQQRRNHSNEVAGIGALESAIFALLGLLLAFTFSGAATRFNERRALAVQEANDVGTAYLRLSVLEPEDRLALQALFRQYTESRLLYYKSYQDEPARDAAGKRAMALQTQIWSAAVVAVQRRGVGALYEHVLAPINTMFDTATMRLAAIRMHPPDAVYAMLLALVVASTLIAGFAMTAGQKRPLLHASVFAVVLTATLYTIVDMEYPRQGILRIDSFDQYLDQVLAGMKP